jgi:hypothetical protein
MNIPLKKLLSDNYKNNEGLGQTLMGRLSHVPLLTNKRWPKVRLFGNFITAAPDKERLVRLLFQLLKPERLLLQPS